MVREGIQQNTVQANFEKAMADAWAEVTRMPGFADMSYDESIKQWEGVVWKRYKVKLKIPAVKVEANKEAAGTQPVPIAPNNPTPSLIPTSAPEIIQQSVVGAVKAEPKEEVDFYKIGEQKILAELGNLEGEDRKKKLKEILDRDYPDKKLPKWLINSLHGAGFLGMGLAVMFQLYGNKDGLKGAPNPSEKSDDGKNPKNEIVVGPREHKDTVATEIIPETEKVEPAPPNRLNLEIYNSLSPEGKIAYKTFAEENPTPGRCWQMLDKANAALYVFDENNNVLAKNGKQVGKIVAGFGETPGDAPNTYDVNTGKGRTTTHSGAFVISNAALESDEKEYGPLQFSLSGFTKDSKGKIKGKHLGLHKTWPEDLKRRTLALQSKTTADNRFSHGCINIGEENFKNILDSFVGDYGELFIVLPEANSKEKFNKETLHEWLGLVANLVVTMGQEQKRLITLDYKKGEINKKDFDQAMLEIDKKTSSMQRYLTK